MNFCLARLEQQGFRIDECSKNLAHTGSSYVIKTTRSIICQIILVTGFMFIAYPSFVSVLPRFKLYFKSSLLKFPKLKDLLPTKIWTIKVLHWYLWFSTLGEVNCCIVTDFTEIYGIFIPRNCL